MKTKKKIIAMVLVITMIASYSSIILASETPNSAMKLNELGMLLNISASDLNADLTRDVGLVMILKALGYTQAEADQKVANSPFKDVTGWAAGWTSLASELGITAGTTSTEFSPKAPLSEREFIAFMLRALGYDKNESYSKALELGVSSGLLVQGSILSKTTYTKALAANVMYNALKATVYNNTGTLADKLIKKGLFTSAQAVAAGVKINEIQISGLTSTDGKIFVVTFNQPVDTAKTIFKIKTGANSYNPTVTWNTGKDIATLALTMALTNDTCTVEVAGITTINLAKDVIVSGNINLEISSNVLELKNGTIIPFKVSNKNGQFLSVDGSAVVATAFNITQKRTEVISDVMGTNESKLQLSNLYASGAILGDVIRITIAYQGIMAQSNCIVVEVAAPSTMSLVEALPLSKMTRITTGEVGLTLSYILYNQYGVPVKLSTHGANGDGLNDVESIGNILFSSSNSSIIDVDSFWVDSNGNLKFIAGNKAGQVTITAIINASGAVETIKIVVEAPSIIAQLTIVEPTTVIAAEETAKLNLIGLDQYGTEVSAQSMAGVTFISSNPLVVANNGMTVINGKLSAIALTSGRTDITAKNSRGEIVGITSIQVEDKAIPSIIKSISYPSTFEANFMASKAISFSNIEVLDQYDRIYDLAQHNTQVNIAAKDGSSDIINIGSGSFSLAGLTLSGAGVVGSEVYIFSIEGSQTAIKEVAFTAVASSDIVRYLLTSIPTMYIGEAYKKSTELIGKTADDVEVVISNNKITWVTTSKIYVASVTSQDNTIVVTGVDQGETTISAWNGIQRIAEINVTVSKVAPTISSVKFKLEFITPVAIGSTVNFLNLIEKLDQYGVVINDSGYWSSSNSSIATITSSSGQLMAISAGQVTINYLSTTGILVSVMLTVQ